MRIIIITTLLITVVLLAVHCMNSSNIVSNDPRGNRYAGSETCASCHKDIYEKHIHTPHNTTSAKVNNDSLAGIIKNTHPFYFGDSGFIKIEEKDGHYFQTNYTGTQAGITARFDLAVGSGEKAQTFAYWKHGQLFQLPLTYFTEMHAWANSPGFEAGKPFYNRLIETNCLKCHASYVYANLVQEGALYMSERMDESSIVFGIDCERCHGPALEHANFHLQNPQEKQSHFIRSIPSLTRQQQLDMCAVCHAGNDRSLQRSTFGFKPGDTLANYYYPEFGADKQHEPDVHGKQLQLLEQSACFQKSQLTCNTCHSMHEPGSTETFINTCMSCHKNSLHADSNFMAAKQQPNAINNCTGCHMPLQASKNIAFNTGAEKKVLPYLLRTHKIAIYPKNMVDVPMK